MSEEAAETVVQQEPRALQHGRRGIQTSHDFANMMSALMSDLIEGRVDPRTANAICNAGSKLLKVVELQHRYGSTQKPEQKPFLHLAE